MSKIITPGNYPKENRMTCDNCYCQFEYWQNEVKSSYFDCCGGECYYYYVECPECKSQCEVDSYFIEHPWGILDFFRKILNKIRRKK